MERARQQMARIITRELNTKLDKNRPSAKNTSAVYGVNLPAIAGSAIFVSGLRHRRCNESKNCPMRMPQRTDKTIPLAVVFWPVGGNPPIGQRIENDCRRYARDARKKKTGFPDGSSRYVMKTPITSANPMPIGNATAIPAMSIAATNKILAILKMTPPSKAEPIVFEFGLPQVRQKASPIFARASERESENKREQQHTEAIVPVEELKPPFLGGELLRVGP